MQKHIVKNQLFLFVCFGLKTKILPYSLPNHCGFFVPLCFLNYVNCLCNYPLLNAHYKYVFKTVMEGKDTMKRLLPDVLFQIIGKKSPP